MIVNILQHTPVWVWGLFCALVALGLSQARTREVSRARATILPLVLIALSLSGVVTAFGQLPLALGMWAAGFWVALHFAAGAVAARGASWSPGSRRFKVPGSWLPLVLIVGLFVTKYVAGVFLAIDRTLAANVIFASILSLTYGAFAGLFWGRARSLHALTRVDTVSQPA